MRTPKNILKERFTSQDAKRHRHVWWHKCQEPLEADDVTFYIRNSPLQYRKIYRLAI